MFNLNKAFVAMALELGGRLKECVVIPSKVWAYAAELSLGEKSHSSVSGQSQVAVLSNWATMAKNLDPIAITGSCSPGQEARSLQLGNFSE